MIMSNNDEVSLDCICPPLYCEMKILTLSPHSVMMRLCTGALTSMPPECHQCPHTSLSKDPPHWPGSVQDKVPLSSVSR